MADQRPRTKWHQLFGFLLQELLTPVGLTIQTELPVSTDPPKIDIIIIKRESEAWTEAQLALLPDGIRDSQASHILLEFKYTEVLQYPGHPPNIGL